MKRRLQVLTLILIVPFFVQSQNVGINSTGTTPAASTILDLNSGNTFTGGLGRGLLIPRMHTADINLISSPATGLLVFNLDCNVFDYWNSTAWITFPTSSYAPQAVNASLSPNPICAGTVTLTGNAIGATSYSWTGPNSFHATSKIATVNVTGTVNAGYYVFTASNSCGSVTAYTDSLQVSGPAAHGSQTFNYVPVAASPAVNTGVIQTFTVPACVTSITIDARGAQGGNSTGNGTGGYGAREVGTFAVMPGDTLNILVGAQGAVNSSGGQGAGGGGGTFVVDTSDRTNTPLIIAGGGGGGGGNGANDGYAGTSSGTGTTGTIGTACGGGGTNGGGGGGSADNGGCESAGGGGGYYGNGGANGNGGGSPGAGGNGIAGVGAAANGGTGGNNNICNTSFGLSYLKGGYGGVGCSLGGCNSTLGGYGGGAGTAGGGGGAGGGYSGGGAGGYDSGASPNTSGGGGGGSLNTGSSPTNYDAYQAGNGEVIITW